MPEIDSGGGGSDSFIMCLGRHATQTRGNDDTLDGGTIIMGLEISSDSEILLPRIK